jgi:acetylornithine deacetylase/succinyl-diaminopimelate desuccinylase-like protein
MSNFANYLTSQRSRFESDLCDWLRMASVSTDQAFAGEVQRAANWLADRFRGLNLTTRIIPTVGHPIVYAESRPVPGAPTVLVYGHYDVQPPDPLNEWLTPPFEPTVRDGKLYARGATDDKGQMLTHLLGAEAWLKTTGQLPVQLKFLIEGEEECGSQGLNEFLAGKYDAALGQSSLDLIRSDIVVISDSSQYGPGQPAVTYGLRGICYYELRLSGPRQDLHSGSFGGAVTNPANALSQILAAFLDKSGRIQVPGFYDDVLPLTAAEREQFADLHFDDAAFMSGLGIKAMTGEEGYSTLERRWARPTFDINGLWSGYQGEGAKTVLPARAGAKFSFRLVPHQDPKKIHASLEAWLKQLCPPGIELELVDMHSAPGSVVPLESPYMQAARAEITRGFGKAPVFIRSGGSIPVVNTFAQKLGIGTLLLGWGQDDDNPHSPNEKFLLEVFHRGIAASAPLWDELGKLKN